jgi:CubicO group peptidase (beta-lactamase class C family)
LLLAHAGKLSLDEPVRKYIPELPNFGVEITIRQLIHHTSGLRGELALLDLAGWRYPMDLITDEDVLTLLSRQKDLNFPPGTRFQYSNTNYVLLGQIVKRVSGQSLREFTTSEIFQPLHMKNTHFRDDHAEIVKNIAFGYEPAKNNFRISNTDYDSVGNTGLLTTVEDLALWDENFYTPRVGNPAMVKQMEEYGKLNDGEDVFYAFGLNIGTYRGLATVDHGGLDAGYRSDMIRFPNQHFTVACLCNSFAADPNQLTRKVAEFYLAKEMRPIESAPVANEKRVQPKPEQLANKTGIYRNKEDGHVVRISVEEDKLHLGWGMDGESHKLRTISEDHFFLLPDQVELTFEPLQPLGSWRLVIKEQQGSSHLLEKIPAFTPSSSALRDYAGVYRSEEIEPLHEIKLEQAGLVLHRLKKEPDLLQPVTRDLFAGSIGNIRFTRNIQGEISGFLLDKLGIQNFRFAKEEK